jgi:hypothetical protein
MHTPLEERLRRARPRAPEPSGETTEAARSRAFGVTDFALPDPALGGPWRLWWRVRRAPRRVLVPVLVTLLAAVVALPAVAIDQRWWFLAQHIYTPTSGPVVVTTGTSAGVPWELTAFIEESHTLCVGFTPNPSNPHGYGASTACGSPVRGLPPVPGAKEEHWVGWATSTPGDASTATLKFIYGPAAANVAAVDLVTDKGRPITVPTVAGPPQLGVNARFYAAVVPTAVLVHALVPRDRTGRALERWDLPIAQ